MRNYRTTLKRALSGNAIVKALMGVMAAALVFMVAVRCKTASVKGILANRSGEGYIDTAIKILIAVVLGALLLGGLYTLFGSTVLPTLVQRIQEMFNYAG